MKIARFLLLVGLGMSVRAESTLYTNLGSGDAYSVNGLGVGGQTAFVVGTMFTATGAGNLMQILVPIADSNGTVTLGLYTDSGGLPGTLLEGWTNLTVSTNNLARPIPLLTVTSVVNPMLSAGTVYWVVATSAVVNAVNGGLEWDQSTQIPTGGMWIGSGTSLSALTASYTNGPPLAIELDAIPSELPGPVPFFSPVQGATGVSLTPALTWGAADGAASYDVYFGTASSPPFATNTTGTTYAPAALSPNTTYYWYLISKNSAGSTPTAIWSFTTGTSSHPPFFTGEVNLGSGVYYLQLSNGNIFGYYNYQFFPVLYHYDLGFEYFLDANDGKAGAYFYDFASSHWLYTSQTYSFPYLYDFTLQAILYYYRL